MSDTQPKRFTTIRNAQDAIDHWWPIWFPEPEVTATPPTMVWDASDQDVIDKLRSARNAAKFEVLYDRGETGDYAHNDSEADLALLSMLSFYTQDPGQLDRLFRGSRLYRPKWERSDYRDMTISRALDRGAYYEPPTNTPGGITVYRSSEGDADPDTGEITSKILIFNQTDLGNAKRLVYHHGKHIRYVHAWKTWLIWTGSRWKIDGSGEIFRLAKDTVKRIYAESTHMSDEDARKRLLKWAETSESGPKLREMVGLAASEPGIPVESTDLDKDRMLLNVLNGTINLRTGELQPHDPEDLITKFAPVEYRPDATCPTWMRFLNDAMAGREGLIEFLQRAVGYSLSGDVRERVLFILHGDTSTGKSTFIDTIHEILVDGEYALRSPNELMVARRNPGAIPTEVASLAGIRFTFVSETSEFDRLDEGKVKDLVSRDPLRAHMKHQNPFTFYPQFKLWVGTNHKPNVRSGDNAIWKRIRLIPFDVPVPEEREDKALPDKLRREFPGILAWAVRGCLAWQKVGMTAPDDVLQATAEYRESMDTLGAFIAEECIVREGSQEPVAVMYKAYSDWSEANGEKPLTKKMLTMRLTERGYPSKRMGRDNVYKYLNIRLRTAMDGEADLETST